MVIIELGCISVCIFLFKGANPFKVFGYANIFLLCSKCYHYIYEGFIVQYFMRGQYFGIFVIPNLNFILGFLWLLLNL